MSDRVRSTVASDRGQSTIIGFVLVVAILILLLLVLQTSAVPAWNQGVEYSHNERVQGEMELVRDDISRAAATGSAGSRSIALGTRYPVRPFLYNPPPPSGTIRTTEPGTVTVTNATASGETGHYWNGTRREFDDRALVYEPNYNEYTTAPTTVYENSLLYNRYSERTRPATDARLVEGRRITLVTLEGNLDRTGQRSHSVEIRPLSAPTTVTTVRSDGPMVVTVPTRLSEETWVELLAEQRVEEGGYVTDVSVTPGDPGTLRITLQADQSYDLRMARVGVGSGAESPDPHYITTDSPAELQVTSGSSERIVFEVRDRYNNPVSGVPVNASVSGPGVLTPVDSVTDADGQAAFRYEAAGTGTATVTGSFGTDPDRDEKRTAEVTVESVEPAGAAAEDPLTIEWIGPSSGADDTYTLDASVERTTTLTVASSPAVEGLDVQYVVDDSSVGTVSSTAGTTDASGQDTVTFTANGDGTVNVYAIGGGDVDVMQITVTDAAGGQPPADSAPSIDSIAVTDNSKTTGTPKYAQFDVDYQVSDDVQLDRIRFTVVRRSDNTRIIDTTTALSGTSASGSETIRGDDQNANIRGESYDVTITVVDSAGQASSETRTITVQ